MLEIKQSLAHRLRRVRLELFGEEGVRALATRLGIPERTWLHYESGATLPAELMLLFLEVTQVEPRWLLLGCGPEYRWGEGLSPFRLGTEA